GCWATVSSLSRSRWRSMASPRAFTISSRSRRRKWSPARWVACGRASRQCAGSILRGTGLGAILGVLPGGGALLASFAAYTVEKKVASAPRQFGSGDIRGVAAPESANNGGAQTSCIPRLTLGIPGNPAMAMMIGALMIHGIAPGPRVMTDRPGLFWGLIASMWLGNLMLVVLNLPLVEIWVRLLRVPYRLLYPVIIVFCCIGAYTINNKA